MKQHDVSQTRKQTEREAEGLGDQQIKTSSALYCQAHRGRPAEVSG